MFSCSHVLKEMNIELNKLYPLKFRPILKQKLWGGNHIKSIYRHNEPQLDGVGESWDVSAIEGDDCEVIDGWLEGNSLAELVKCIWVIWLVIRFMSSMATTSLCCLR